MAEAVKTLDLAHAVITSVNRDDLADGGAAHWAETVRQVRRRENSCRDGGHHELGRAPCIERSAAGLRGVGEGSACSSTEPRQERQQVRRVASKYAHAAAQSPHAPATSS